MRVVRVAIIGLNHYHVTGWAETLTHLQSRVEVVGLYDPDPSRGETLAPDYHDPSLSPQLGASYRNVPFYDNLHRLLREQRPDVALVMLPNADTPAAIEILAQSGVHAFVDKPGGRTAAELARAMDLARSAGVIVGTGLMWRYNAETRSARDIVRTGKAGRLLGTEATLVTSSVIQRNPRNPLFNPTISGGGVLHWLGVHRIDSLRWITGQEIVAVQAMTANAGGQPIEVEETAAVCLQFEGGAIGMLYAGYHLPRWTTTGYISIHGTELSLSLVLGSAGVMVTSADRTEVMAPPPSGVPTLSGYGGTNGVTAIADWLDTVAGRSEPVSTGDDLVQALAVIDAAYESARSGCRVAVARYGTVR